MNWSTRLSWLLTAIILFVNLSLHSQFGQSIVLNQDEIDVRPYLKLLNADEIRNFKTGNDNQILKYSPDKKIYTYKFDIQNTGKDRQQKWFLLFDKHGLHDVRLATLNNNEDELRVIPFVHVFNFPVLIRELPTSHDEQQFILQSNVALHDAPVKIISNKELVQLSLQRNIFHGVYFGFIIMMLFYNLFIYFFERDRSFIFYVLYVIMNGLLVAAYQGYFDYFAAHTGTRHFLSFILSLNIISLLYFSKEILDLKENLPLVNKWLNYLFLPASIVLCVLALIIEDEAMLQFITFWHVFLMIGLAVLAYSVYLKSIRSALFFMIGSLLFPLCLIVYLLNHEGILQFSFISYAILEIASVLQLMFFSFALGDKIRTYKKLKFQMENELLHSLKQNEEIILEQNRVLEISAAQRSKELIAQKERSDGLLLNILPADVANEMKERGHCEAKLHQNVSVLYTDFVNFTRISENLSPKQLVEQLDLHFKAFDNIIDQTGLEKIRTVGDAYIAACGLQDEQDHAQKTMNAALQIRDYINKCKKEGSIFDIRMGIHSGPVVSGIVGDKKFTYDIWGETVNVASKLEQLSHPGKVNVSWSTSQLGKDHFSYDYQGKFFNKSNQELEYYFVEKN